MGTVRSYRDLVVWQKAVELVSQAFEIADRLPRAQVYGLTSQIQRAAVSVPANIAEGNGRNQLGDYLRYLSIANGSLMELETHVWVAQRLGFIDLVTRDRLLESTMEVGRMLASLIVRLKSCRPTARRVENRRLQMPGA
jgi:four helix bundle protein